MGWESWAATGVGWESWAAREMGGSLMDSNDGSLSLVCQRTKEILWDARENGLSVKGVGVLVFKK